MSNFGKALRAIRLERGMTQEELAALLGTSKQVISRYENSQRSPKISVAEKYARILGVSLADLDGESATSLSHPSLIPICKKRVRMLGKIAAGEPIYADEDYEAYVPVDGDLECDFALEVEGDSMVPRFLPGDIVYFREQPDVNDGQIAAVIVDDNATLKHVYHIPGGLQLISDNLNYPPMNFDAKNSSSVRILGLAVGYYRRIK